MEIAVKVCQTNFVEDTRYGQVFERRVWRLKSGERMMFRLEYDPLAWVTFEVLPGHGMSFPGSKVTGQTAEGKTITGIGRLEAPANESVISEIRGHRFVTFALPDKTEEYEIPILDDPDD